MPIIVDPASLALERKIEPARAFARELVADLKRKADDDPEVAMVALQKAAAILAVDARFDIRDVQKTFLAACLARGVKVDGGERRLNGPTTKTAVDAFATPTMLAVKAGRLGREALRRVGGRCDRDPQMAMLCLQDAAAEIADEARLDIRDVVRSFRLLYEGEKLERQRDDYVRAEVG